MKFGGGEGAYLAGLAVVRGSQIIAEGTSERPIIFTSVLDRIQPGEIYSTTAPDLKGLWGGIILCGDAPVFRSDQAPYYGEYLMDIPGDFILPFGGEGPGDAGRLKYVSIRHAGFDGIGAPYNLTTFYNNESSQYEGYAWAGLTLAGIGAATSLENIEVIGTESSAFEVIGGEVRASNLLAWENNQHNLRLSLNPLGQIDNFIGIQAGDYGIQTAHCLIESPQNTGIPETSFLQITNSTFSGGGRYADLNCSPDAMAACYFFGFGRDGIFETSTDNLSDIQINTSDLTGGNTQIDDILVLDNNINLDSDQVTIVGSPTVGANPAIFANWSLAWLRGVLDDL